MARRILVNRKIIYGVLAAGLLTAAAVVLVVAIQRDHDVNTHIILQASPAQTWAVLNDFSSYPAWNPHLRALQGQPQPRARTRLAEIFTDGAVREREIQMKSMAKDYEFIWEGELAPLPRLLSAKRKLIMTPDPQGGTSLRHEIEFRGLLAGPLTQAMFDRYLLAMQQMNTALQHRLETAQ